MSSCDSFPAACYDGGEEELAATIIDAHAEVLIGSKGFEPDSVADEEMIGRILPVISSFFCTIFEVPPCKRYEDIFEQMAGFATHLAKDHLFFDGNKRTTTKVTFAMLYKAGITFDIGDPDDIEHNEIYLWIQDIVTGGRTEAQLASYLRENCIDLNR